MCRGGGVETNDEKVAVFPGTMTSIVPDFGKINSVRKDATLNLFFSPYNAADSQLQRTLWMK